MTSLLRESRSKAKHRFFEDIGFLFDSWKCAKWLITKDVSFLEPSVTFANGNNDEHNISTIPKAITGNVENVSAQNKLLLKALYVDRTELFYEVKYDVWVAVTLTSLGKPKNGTEWERKRMIRSQSLLPAAFNFVLAYCQTMSKYEFLSFWPLTWTHWGPFTTSR